MTPKAFTIKDEGRLKSIITPITIRQARDLCVHYNIPLQQANVRALWDTGATDSSVSQGLARYLGLKPIDMCMVNGFGGLQSSCVYLIDILLPSNVGINNNRVVEFVDNGFFEIIIGMDIITLGDLAISNKNDNTIVSFRIPPSDNPIDFVKTI